MRILEEDMLLDCSGWWLAALRKQRAEGGEEVRPDAVLAGTGRPQLHPTMNRDESDVPGSRGRRGEIRVKRS